MQWSSFSLSRKMHSEAQCGKAEQKKNDWKWRKNAKGSKCAEGLSKEFNRKLISVYKNMELFLICQLIASFFYCCYFGYKFTCTTSATGFIAKKQQTHAKNVNDKSVKRKYNRKNKRLWKRRDGENVPITCCFEISFFSFRRGRVHFFLLLMEALSTNDIFGKRDVRWNALLSRCCVFGFL